MNKKPQNPFLPFVNLKEILAFDINRPVFQTNSPLVNAVCEAIIKQKPISCEEISEYLNLDERKLSGALQIITGSSLNEIRLQIQVKILKACISEHPEWTPDQVAKHIGFSSRSSLWRFYKSIGYNEITGNH